LATYVRGLKLGEDVYSAAESGNAKVLRDQLRMSEVQLDVNRPGFYGYTALHLAASRGHCRCCEVLIQECHADVNKKSQDAEQNGALHLAARRGHEGVVKLVLETANAEVNLQNSAGWTALHEAVVGNHVPVVELLLRDCRVNRTLPSTTQRTARDLSSPAIARLFDSVAPEPPAEGGPSKTGADPFAHSVPIVTDHRTLDETLGIDEGEVGDLEIGGRKSTRDAESLFGAGAPGLSSFLMQAGAGAFSRAFLKTIAEDPEDDEESRRASQRAPTDPVGLDSFDVISMLGEGVFGKVYKVRLKNDDKVFAMKLLSKSKYKSQNLTQKAFTERFVLRTIRHPYMVCLHYAFQTPRFWALVMDFAGGGSLHDQLLKTGNPGLPLRKLAKWHAQIVLALNHLHNHKVLFRDMKPENVVLDEKHDAKLIDFGLAKSQGSGSGDLRAVTVCGSYGYVAPEIVRLQRMRVDQRKEHAYGVAADFYSLGVTMFVCATGGELAVDKEGEQVCLPPVDHNTLREKLGVLAARLQDPKCHAQLEIPTLPEALVVLLTQLCEEDPEKRPTGQEIQDCQFFKSQGVDYEELLPKHWRDLLEAHHKQLEQDLQAEEGGEPPARTLGGAGGAGGAIEMSTLPSRQQGTSNPRWSVDLGSGAGDPWLVRPKGR